MKAQALHVLHAIDPAGLPEGPGFDFGVKPALAKVIHHIELAAASADATENVRAEAERVVTSARNSLERADQIMKLVKQIQSAQSAAEATPLTDRIEALCAQLANDGEGGL